MDLSPLKKVSLFAGLTDEQLKSIASLCNRKMLAAGQLLFRENDNGNAFYIVLSGSIKIYTEKSGEEKILTVLAAGDSFGELSLIDGKPRSASARAVEHCMLLELLAADFQQLLKNHFDITLGVMRELAERLRATNQHVHDLTFLDARSRIIKALVQLANKNGQRTGTSIVIRMVLNYDELCRMAGVPKTTLMEVFRDLSAKEIIRLTADDLTIDLAKLR